MEPLFKQRTDLAFLHDAVEKVRLQLKKVIIGQDAMVKMIIAALLADGHVLLEGVPGVAKTLTAKLTARCMNVQFSRIQFTPDLMPSDVLGTPVFNPQDAQFEFKRGPVFSNVVLIDEINRAPAKTQAALFEVMEERQVTMDGKTYPMQTPFIVLATQNPIEQEGTYRLPEAQLDRFLFKIVVPYPTEDEELQILTRFHQNETASIIETIEPVWDAIQIRDVRRQVRGILIDENLLQFIAAVIHQTRHHKALYLGASPRASLAVMNASKALAAIAGRDFVTPEDIIEAATPVLRHRIILSPDKEMEGVSEDSVIEQIIHSLHIPR